MSHGKFLEATGSQAAIALALLKGHFTCSSNYGHMTLNGLCSAWQRLVTDIYVQSGRRKQSGMWQLQHISKLMRR